MNFEVLTLDKIRVLSDFNHRLDWAEEDIRELANQIALTGYLAPPVVNKRHELVAGERRIRALKILEAENRMPEALKKGITCQIGGDTEDEVKARIVSLIENVGRKDLNWVERAGGYFALYQEMKGRDNHLKMEDAAAQIGVSRSALSNYLRIAREPWFQEAEDLVRKGASLPFSEVQARAVAGKGLKSLIEVIDFLDAAESAPTEPEEAEAEGEEEESASPAPMKFQVKPKAVYDYRAHLRGAKKKKVLSEEDQAKYPIVMETLDWICSGKKPPIALDDPEE